MEKYLVKVTEVREYVMEIYADDEDKAVEDAERDYCEYPADYDLLMDVTDMKFEIV